MVKETNLHEDYKYELVRTFNRINFYNREKLISKVEEIYRYYII
jgi:hypothetical protein